MKHSKAVKKENFMLVQIGSLAMAIEAIETILVAEGICSEGDIMKQINALVAQKTRNL